MHRGERQLLRRRHDLTKGADVEVFVPTLGYRWIHFVHLLAVLAWVGVAVAAQLRLGQVLSAGTRAGRLAAAHASRRLTLLAEMPLVGALLAAGVVLAAMHPDVFTQPWFHTKLLAVVLILFLFSWSTTRQKRVVELLEGSEEEERPKGVRAQINLFRTLRAIAALIGVVLVFAITLRFGADAIDAVTRPR